MTLLRRFLGSWLGGISHFIVGDSTGAASLEDTPAKFRKRRKTKARLRFIPPPNDGKVRLNLGSGDKNLDGYTNVDVAPSRKGTVPDVICDLRKLDKFDNESVDEILSIHVIEHFYQFEVSEVLAEWCRILKPGGLITLECPSLLYAAQQLVGNPSLALGEGKDWATTMFVFYGDPQWKDPLMCHRWGWTAASLIQELGKNGFTAVREEPAQFKRGHPRDFRVVGEKI